MICKVIIPSWSYWKNPMKLQPLWELYYATLIRQSFTSLEVKVEDLRDKKKIFDPESADIFFFWLMKSADADEVYEISKKIKLQNSKALTIIGGTHADHMSAQTLENCDCVLQGTAEDTLKEVISNFIKKKEKTKGVIQKVKINKFNEFDFPRRDFIEKEKIVNNLHFEKYGGVVGTGAYFSRGCSFSCRFCVYNNPPVFEYNSFEKITNEIEYLKKKYGVEGINLRDEVCIPVNKKIAVPYLEAIGKQNIIWRGQTVPLGSEELLKIASQTGLKELALGIESVDSDMVLEISNKPSKSIANNIKYIELCRKYGIKVKVCLIFGLPGESKNVLKKTIDFLDSVKPDYVAVSGFAPVPGSPFYQNPKKYGIKHIYDDLSQHAHLLYRFDEDEDSGLPFEYESTTPFGKSLSRDEIIFNIKEVQKYLREREMSY
ncbi:MAG: hypothetical protein CMG39_04370 [Candidatus Marinimicrobia bacterium]|nr:hypothetical protein [Candidatus Neomarinimicrobiota bacterium]|tara:strand:- start:554 stop:1849 length:1296 start_codon:yes stop_codon:yes gene_type:complete